MDTKKFNEVTMELLSEVKDDLIILQDRLNYDDLYSNRIAEALGMVKLMIDDLEDELKEKQ